MGIGSWKFKTKGRKSHGEMTLLHKSKIGCRLSNRKLGTFKLRAKYHPLNLYNEVVSCKLDIINLELAVVCKMTCAKCQSSVLAIHLTVGVVNCGNCFLCVFV